MATGAHLKVAAVGGVVMITTRRSRRTRCTFLSSPSSRSVLMLRSCASDTATTLQQAHRYVQGQLPDENVCNCGDALHV